MKNSQPDWSESQCLISFNRLLKADRKIYETFIKLEDNNGMNQSGAIQPYLTRQLKTKIKFSMLNLPMLWALQGSIHISFELST